MRCAVYCRLSKEDEDRHAESESIQNQKSLLVRYAVERGWDIYKIYSDEDYSGVDRDRPEFCAMLSDARDKKFDIVLCKTQSRFTRDMELLETYVHRQFPLWGIRFVTAVDHIDTDIKGGKKFRQINGLVNEWYLEDLSDNIRAVFDHKRRNGQYIGGFPVYGYQKDPERKNHLIVDAYAAEIVREIFSLYLAGLGKQKIAERLNGRHVLNPTQYKQSKGSTYVNAHAVGDRGLWNRTTIGRILKNEMYLGTMVQGRRKKISYKSKQLIDVPPEDWFRVEGTHEAVIDRHTFDTAGQLMRTRTRTDGTGETHILSGRVRCLDCGGILCKTSRNYENRRRSYLRCKLYTVGKTPRLCTGHSIRLDALTGLAEEKIRAYLDRYYTIGDISRFADTDPRETRRAALERELLWLNGQLRRRAAALQTLYLDRASGLLEEAQFVELLDAFQAEKQSLRERLDAAEAERAALGGEAPSGGVTVERITRLLEAAPASRALVSLLIDTIEVGEKRPTGQRDIHIRWLF